MSAILEHSLEQRLEVHRAELTNYCRWRLRSAADAEDAVQETFLRAWRSFDRFEGRATLRSWLYQIARNVCFDIVTARRRQAELTGLGSSTSVDASSETARGEDDPADAVVAHEGVRLAFMAALLHLPPRQRAALILCEVLRWRATEAADLLGMSTASVNSALQRARAALATTRDTADPPDNEQHRLVTRYVDAFERYDIDSLVALLRPQ